MELHGAKELEVNLVALGRRGAGRVARSALRDGARLIQRQAIADAPERTGLLRRNIKVRAGKSRPGLISVVVLIGKAFFQGKTFYGAFLEFGWRHGSRKLGNARKLIPGRHFLEGAYEKRGEEAADMIINSIATGIEAEATRLSK